MKISVTYMKPNIFENLCFTSDEQSNVTILQLKRVLQYFVDLKARYTELNINKDAHCIKNTVLKINKTVIYYTSVDNFNNRIVTVKTHIGHNEYNVEEMSIVYYQFKILKQIRERNIIDDNIDTLFV